MVSIKRILPTVIAALIVVGCSGKQESTATQPAPDINAGKSYAKANCIGCHSMDGKGINEDIPHLAAQVDKYLYASLKAYKQGKRSHAALRDMTAKMSDADMQNVTAYFSSLPPLKATGVAQEYDIHAKGKATASACAACHQSDGNSTTAGIPGLAGQQPGYFISAVKAYMDGKRKISSKEKEAAMVSALNQVDIEAMALYYAVQKPAQRSAPAFGDVKSGEPLTANCGSCHGAQGVSRDENIPGLAGQDAQYLVSAIKAYRDRERKQEDMHTFLYNVSDKDINDIAAYYSVQKSLAAEESAITMKELAVRCDRCHAPGMENPMIIFPRIYGQNKGYLVNALHAYRDNKRGSSPMHKMSLPYSEAVIEGIATWYANQPAN